MSTKIICYEKGYDSYISVDTGLYPDNTPVFSLAEGAYTPIYKLPRAVYHNYSTMAEFVGALALAKRLGVKTFYCPYLPGARQDKPRDVSSSGDILPTLDFVLNMVEAAGIEFLHVFDFHNPGFTDFPHGLHVANMKSSVLADFFPADKYDGIIAPDKGASGRAIDMSIAMGGLPVFFGRKERDPNTNALSRFEVPSIRPGHYLVVDDICDAGGTFVGLGEAIADAGATADLFVSHGIFSKGAVGRLREKYYEITTTDSLPTRESGVRYIDISKIMTEVK